MCEEIVADTTKFESCQKDRQTNTSHYNIYIMNLIKFLTQLWGSQRKSERELFQVLDDIEIVADTTKFDSHQMAFQ